MELGPVRSASTPGPAFLGDYQTVGDDRDKPQIERRSELGPGVTHPPTPSSDNQCVRSIRESPVVVASLLDSRVFSGIDEQGIQSFTHQILPWGVSPLSASM